MRHIFIGTTDIASQISEFKRGFESLGHKVFTAIMIPHTFMVQGKYDTVVYDAVPRSLKNTRTPGLRLVRRLLLDRARKRLLNYAIKHCDTFVFIWSSFFNNRRDFRLLRALKKKLWWLLWGMIFAGFPLWNKSFALMDFLL